MARTIYCWRCSIYLPMLTEQEWLIISPLLENPIAEIRRFRDVHQCSLVEAKAYGMGRRALEMYQQLTGFYESNYNALFHHRLSLYGPDCGTCGKPLRTPRAQYCAACGAVRN